MENTMESHHLKPVDIPLIITSNHSSPDASRKRCDTPLTLELAPAPIEMRKNSIDSRKKSLDSRQRSEERRASLERKSKVGGSLKYDIGRNNSVSNLINPPAKWSSVRIKGTGFKDSRKSVVKIEPCNGAPNINKKEYENLKSPNSSNNHMKANIGNVSLLVFVYVCAKRTRCSFFLQNN